MNQTRINDVAIRTWDSDSAFEICCVVAYVGSSFVFITIVIFYHEYIKICLSILINMYLGCLQVFTILSESNVNILEQFYLWIYFSFLLCTNIGQELLGHNVGECINLLEAAKPSFKVILSFYMCTNNVWVF
jgi:hypothetical protein